MVGPFTPNAGFVVPNTGDLVDTWGDDATNPDYVAIDGMFCGVQGISLGSSPVTLTSETGFTPTPGAGPTQSQNRVLRLTGVLTANVTITLPIPGGYIVENLTTGSFDVIFRGVTATEVIAVPQGDTVNIYNDGSRVRFAGLGKVGQMEHWAGISSMPSWVGQCTVKPYLLCDDTTYNISDYPYLGAKFGSKFGGNGLTTFANPDMRGRVPLAYDGSANRITTAGSGIDGDTIGAVGGAETVTLTAGNIPSITSTNSAQSITVNPSGSSSNYVAGAANSAGWTLSSAQGGGSVLVAATPNTTILNINSFSGNNSISVSYTNGSQTAVNKVQPSIVTGIWVVKT